MKNLLGVLLIIAGIAVGIYCGFWWAFIGGIMQVIEQVRADQMDKVILGMGIAKILFAGLIGWASASFLVIPGMLMLSRE